MKEPYYKTHEPPHCPTCDCGTPALADTQRAIIEAAEMRGYSLGRNHAGERRRAVQVAAGSVGGRWRKSMKAGQIKCWTSGTQNRGKVGELIRQHWMQPSTPR